MVRPTSVSYNVHTTEETKQRVSDTNYDRYSKVEIVTPSEEEFVFSVKKIVPALETGHGLTWAECVFEIFFSIQGPFFFILPHAFKQLGYLPSIVGTIIISVLYIHVLHMYLWCEREIIRRRKMENVHNIPLERMIEYVFGGTPAKKKIAKYLNAYWKYEIVLSWSLSISLSELFISQNIQFLIEYNFGYTLTVDQILLAMFPITTLIAYIPNLKVMSMLAFVTTGVFILTMFFVMYMILVNPDPLPPVTAIGDLSNLATFVATIMLTINFTPLLFQLKQEVTKRSILESRFGCVNVTMFLLIALNVCFSLFAYLRYGDSTADNILENLPQTRIMVAANVALTGALICCNSISFFVVFQTVWCDGLSKNFSTTSYPKVYEYFARTLTNLFITSMAMLVPTLEIFINLTSSFSCPYDSVLLPMLLQLMLVHADGKRDSRFYLTCIKSIVFLVLSIGFSIICFLEFVTQITAYYETY